MNILIPDSWLRDFLATKATPKQIAEALSLHSASVDNIEKIGQDFVYDIEITTNRNDMASVYGIAREASTALTNMDIKAELKPYSAKSFSNQKIDNDYIKAKIVKTKICPRFTTVLCSAKVNKSPAWLRERLIKAGINPHNNIVDVTNYVMLETGQPMHAFDYDKIAKKIMTLRESKRGEKITIIDGEKIELNGGDIVIEDGNKKLIDLCGIKGGENSAINDKTKNVLLFTQKYDPVRIRKTIQTTGVRTEAATLFEKGTDPEQTVIALKRAFELLEEIANAKLTGGLIDIYPMPHQQKEVLLDYKLIKAVTGVEIEKAKIKSILQALGFKINNQTVTVPSWRRDDINIPEDIVEEIIRMYGYQNIPANIPPLFKPLSQPHHDYFYWENEVKRLLKNLGFNEVYTYSLVSQKISKAQNPINAKPIKISNPLNEDTQYLRPSLIPSLLEVIKKNKNRVEKLKLFELANIYLPTKDKNKLPLQKPMLTIVSNSLKLMELKQGLELLLHNLNITNYQFVQEVNEQNRARISINDRNVGYIYSHGSISIADIDFQSLVNFAHKFKKCEPISEYPPLIEDMTFTLPPKTHLGPVVDKIKSCSKLIKKVELHDTYQNNFTFRITYQSPQKSLSSDDVVKTRKKISKTIERNFKAKLKA